MLTKDFTRRDFSVRLATMFAGFGVAGSGLGAGSAQAALVRGSDEISHTEEAIHQEVNFKASRKRVYEALTETKQFDKVVKLSAAMQSGMITAATPTEISRETGGAFTIFGGHIVGRHVELVPNERIVQAWRVVDWNAGVYSIVKFELTEQDGGTKLVLDHAGFPVGGGQHYADGWKVNYWEPMAKYLA
jgi:activator of HSP90 ATPase